MSAQETRGRGQEGFALVLALLALMLLTFLGLTLATTTSTELQIATNYRWSQQALYNAEAGLEAGKTFLRDVPGDWDDVLPVGRAGVQWTWDDGNPSLPVAPPAPGGLATVDYQGRPLRHWENADCDGRGGHSGYGVVLSDPGAPTPRGPFQYVTTTMGQSLNGAFTLWVRRGVIYRADGMIEDDMNPNAVVLTSEGLAPYIDTQLGSTMAQRNAASRTLEVTLIRATSADTCESYRGQAGGGVSGSGFWNCGVLGGSKGGCEAAEAIGESLGDAQRGSTETISGQRVATDDAGTLCDTGVK